VVVHDLGRLRHLLVHFPLLFNREQESELLLGTRVVAVQVKLRTLTTAAGESITYDILIVATGSRVSSQALCI